MNMMGRHQNYIVAMRVDSTQMHGHFHCRKGFKKRLIMPVYQEVLCFQVGIRGVLVIEIRNCRLPKMFAYTVLHAGYHIIARLAMIDFFSFLLSLDVEVFVDRLFLCEYVIMKRVKEEI